MSASLPSGPAPKKPKKLFLCGVCGLDYSTKSNRDKHIRFSKSCSGRSQEINQTVVTQSSGGHQVTIVKVSESVVEMAVKPSEVVGGGMVCSYCSHHFSTPSNIRKHKCLLQPRLEPATLTLKLLTPSLAATFRENHQWNTPSEVAQTCLSLAIAVPGDLNSDDFLVQITQISNTIHPLTRSLPLDFP